MVIFPDLVRIHRISREDIVIPNPESLRRSVQDHHDRDRTDGQLSCIDHLYRTCRNFRQRLDHLCVDLVRVCGADDIIGEYLIPSLRTHPVHFPIANEYLFDFLAELDLRSVLLDLSLQLHTHLMGEIAADITSSAEVIRHKEGVNRERK